MDSDSGLDLTVPRSCWSCHKRKVRCDKELPCGTCVRTNAHCSYPELEKRKKSRRIPVGALLTRLAQLEKKVSTLSKSQHEAVPAQPASAAAALSNPGLLLSQGVESRYFSDDLMASIALEVKDLYPTSEQALIHGDKIEGDVLGSLSLNDADRVAPGILTISPDTRSGWQALRLWQVFLDNIDPLIKIVHVPTAQPRIYAAVQGGDDVEDSQKMLLYSTCYAAVVTLDDEVVQSMLGLGKGSALRGYRDEIEKYLGKLSLMLAPNLEYLQALTIFLTLLRVSDNSRSVWILTGLAVRIAQSLGLHKDGTVFRLAPFECEIRRRLWWQISIIEVRAAEDYGLLSLLQGTPKDPPQYPSNLNDRDIFPGMTVAPVASGNFTDMTLALLRIQVTDLIIFQGLYPLSAKDGPSLLKGVEEKRKTLREAHDRIFTQFLTGDEIRDRPAYEGGLMLWKFSLLKSDFLLLFRAFQSILIVEKEAVRKEAILSAVTMLEQLPKVVNNYSFKRFMWYLKSYPQWYAMGFLLQQLYQGKMDDAELMKRVQNVLEDAFLALEDTDSGGTSQRRGAVWVAMCLLRDKALNRQASEGGAAGFAVGGTTENTMDGGLGTASFPTPESSGSDSSMGLDLDFDFTAQDQIDMSLFETPAEWNNMEGWV